MTVKIMKKKPKKGGKGDSKPQVRGLRGGGRAQSPMRAFR